MYDSRCDPDRKVIPKKTRIGPLIMCCTRLVNSVTDYYKWISTVYIMTFKSKQFQYWQKQMYIHNLTLDKYHMITLPETSTKNSNNYGHLQIHCFSSQKILHAI